MDTLCRTSRSFFTTFLPLYLEFNVSLIVRCRNHNAIQISIMPQHDATFTPSAGFTIFAALRCKSDLT